MFLLVLLITRPCYTFFLINSTTLGAELLRCSASAQTLAMNKLHTRRATLQICSFSYFRCKVCISYFSVALTKYLRHASMVPTSLA